MADTTLAVTIGFPVYNVERYVEKALLSALNQDFTFGYEILVVDDCSTDNSMAIVHHLSDTHQKGTRIRTISHTCNRGRGQARNTIINNAKGDYLFFLDSDDWIEENALSILYKKVIETGADIAVGSLWYINKNEERIIYKAFPQITISHENAGVYYYLATDAKVFTTEMCGKLWSLEFMKSHSIYCVDRIMEDVIPNYIAFIESSTICFLPEFLYYYNMKSESSIMRSRSSHIIVEKVYTYASIINNLQALTINHYRDIPGIYDLFLKTVRLCYRGVLSLSPGAEQIAFFNARVKGCLSIIPSLRNLKTKNGKLMYLFCKSNSSLEWFSRYEHLLSSISRTVMFINRWKR